MNLGDIGNIEALANGKPLDGVRILALEQMQALPYATQLLSRLGAAARAQSRVEVPFDAIAPKPGAFWSLSSANS